MEVSCAEGLVWGKFSVEDGSFPGSCTKKGDWESSPLQVAQTKEQKAKVQMGHFPLTCRGS